MPQLSYKRIVTLFEEATTAHKGVFSFGFGSIDNFDALSQNVKYPYVFLRPLQSAGLQNMTRTLNFELYCLDVPTLSNQEPVDIMNNMEQTIYDILSYFNRGSYQQDIQINLSNIIPTLEAFNDRAFGWVANIAVVTDGKFDYCNFPS